MGAFARVFVGGMLMQDSHRLLSAESMRETKLQAGTARLLWSWSACFVAMPSPESTDERLMFYGLLE